LYDSIYAPILAKEIGGYIWNECYIFKKVSSKIFRPLPEREIIINTISQQQKKLLSSVFYMIYYLYLLNHLYLSRPISNRIISYIINITYTEVALDVG